MAVRFVGVRMIPAYKRVSNCRCRKFRRGRRGDRRGNVEQAAITEPETGSNAESVAKAARHSKLSVYPSGMART